MSDSFLMQSHEILKPHGVLFSANQHVVADWPCDLTQAYWTVFNHESYLHVFGQDAAQFLQGQLTCDVLDISKNQMIYGACCNPKGRMISNFRLIKLASDEFVLILPAGQADILRAAIIKYTVFYKVTLNTSLPWVRVGILAPPAYINSLQNTSELPNMQIIHTSNQQIECWVAIDYLDQFISKQLSEYKLASTMYWQLAVLKQGIAWVDNEGTEKHLPQDLNWDLVKGINFKKGCYTGQEIIARLHYRGQPKMRLQYFTCSDPVFKNDLIHVPDTAIQGLVIDAIDEPTTRLTHLLAKVRVNQTGWLTVTNHTILNPQVLPYSVSN